MSTAVEEALRQLTAALSAEQSSEAAPELLSVESAARRLGVGRAHLYRELLAGGQLRSVTVGRRRLIPSTAIAEFIAAREAAAVGARWPKEVSPPSGMKDEGLVEAHRGSGEDL